MRKDSRKNLNSHLDLLYSDKSNQETLSFSPLNNIINVDGKDHNNRSSKKVVKTHIHNEENLLQTLLGVAEYQHSCCSKNQSSGMTHT